MSHENPPFRRRTVLKTIGMSAVASGAFAGVSSADSHCDATVGSGDSIQAAIDNASAGDTICVEDGTYNERIVINKELTVESVNEHGATIHFLHDENNPGFSTVDILADDVTLRDFEVIREVDPTIYNGGKRYAQGVKVGGFDASGGSNSVIENNIVEFVGTHDDPDELSDNGIWVMDPQNGGDADNVSVIDNEVSGFGDTGIASLSPYGDSVTDVTIRGNTVEEIDRGDPNPIFIYLLDSTGTVEDNTVDNKGGDSGLQTGGIRVDGDSDVEIRNNTVEGYHRAGILVNDSEDAYADIMDNEVHGVGPKDDGWAENGIQVSRGATATVKRNTVEDHWWDNDSFVSSGIIIFESDDVTVQHNTVTDNDLGVALFGDDNNAIHNDIEVTESDPGDSGTSHYGVMVSGDDNGVRQSSITAVDGDVGIYIFGGSDRTKLIRNTLEGWDDAIVDQGDDTKLPAPFEPDE